MPFSLRPLVPSEDVLNSWHEVAVTLRGMRGILSRGMVAACVGYAMRDVYSYRPFVSAFDAAAALMYAIITFHPYVDGNKRTALIGSSLTLAFNGMLLTIPSDAPQFALTVAKRCEKQDHVPMTEVDRISSWLRSNSLYDYSYFAISLTMRAGILLHMYPLIILAFVTLSRMLFLKAIPRIFTLFSPR